MRRTHALICLLSFSIGKCIERTSVVDASTPVVPDAR